MDWYALEELDTAWEKTKEVILPFDLKTWARFFVIVIFTGASMNMPTFFGNFGEGSGFEDSSSNSDLQTTAASFDDINQSVTGLAAGSAGQTSILAALGALFVSVVLFLILISSVFELVYYQSLIDENVRIRPNFREHFGKGFRYFGFRLTSGLLAILLLGISSLVFSWSPVFGGLLLAASLIFLVPLSIVLGLTNNFVLPRMIEADENVIEGWRNIYDSLRQEWKQVGVYIVIRFFVKMMAGIVGVFWMLVALLLVGVPFSLIGLVFYLAAEWLVIIPVIIGVVIWVILLIAGQIPIQTYLYSYALMVYHDLTS
jgi:hypothetical protein